MNKGYLFIVVNMYFNNSAMKRETFKILENIFKSLKLSYGMTL